MELSEMKNKAKIEEITSIIDDLIEGIEIDNPIELSEYLEAKNIPHYYCWNASGVPICFDSVKENPKLLFSIGTGDDIKSCVKLLIRK